MPICEVIYPDPEDYQPLLSWDELRGMRDSASYILGLSRSETTKREQRLARRLLHAVSWIEVEAKAIQKEREQLDSQAIN